MKLTDLRRRDAYFVVLALVSTFAYLLAAHNAGGSGFPLDDAWIHQTYGRNLAQSGTWSFVAGVPSGGSTAPLYTLLLALGNLLNVPYLLWAALLGAAALALMGMFGARLAERLFVGVRGVGWWTGAALCLTWHLIWGAVAGMETAIFSALILIACELAARQLDAGLRARERMAGGAALGAVCAALIAARPEGALLAAMLGAALLIRLAAERRAALAWLIGVLVAGSLCIAPYLLLNLSLNGAPLPNTFNAKQAQYAPLLARGFPANFGEMLMPLAAGGQFALIFGAFFGMRGLLRQHQRGGWAFLVLPLAWSFALIALYALRLPASYQHGRYVIPALPTFIVIGVGGTLMLSQALTTRRRGMLARLLGRSLPLLALLLFATFWLIGASVFAQDVQMINSEMVAAAVWLRDNVPPDELLAVHDIGAVGFFANRPILDVAGLVSPEVVPLFYRPAELFALMRERDVRWLMVLPDQWAWLWQGQAETFGRYFCRVYNTKGLMGGTTIYRFAASGNCPS
ncbi:MAG: hypothetical protein DYG88_06345 [Chloroflexi bacterium CFX4]|nr:hypothetical protein [Chloroflexi bacterium CFX4]MDL1922771.1 hypothetical protein [Chloroflexi bacterium CFX3]